MKRLVRDGLVFVFVILVAFLVFAPVVFSVLQGGGASLGTDQTQVVEGTEMVEKTQPLVEIDSSKTEVVEGGGN